MIPPPEQAMGGPKVAISLILILSSSEFFFLGSFPRRCFDKTFKPRSTALLIYRLTSFHDFPIFLSSLFFFPLRFALVSS